MSGLRAAAIWGGLAVAIAVPLGAAAFSPLLAWRLPVYILAGFAGIVALGVVLVQPLLVSGALPGLRAARGRRAHIWAGGGLVTLVLIHVGGLWLTSPPDMVDALLFRAPTLFSLWGVLAMWAVFGAAFWAALRRALPLRVWRVGHTALVLVAALGSVAHTVLIQGTMEPWSKYALCALVLLALAATLRQRQIWAGWRRRRRA